MRRNHQTIQELIAAHRANFVNGDESEAVLKASLKALGLDREEINLEYWKACTEKLRTHGALLTAKERAYERE